MTKTTKKIAAGVLFFAAGSFFLGVKVGHRFSPGPTTVTCGHCPAFMNDKVQKMSEETDKWLSRLDEELK